MIKNPDGHLVELIAASTEMRDCAESDTSDIAFEDMDKQELVAMTRRMAGFVLSFLELHNHLTAGGDLPRVWATRRWKGT